jgi:hypothetical protein
VTVLYAAPHAVTAGLRYNEVTDTRCLDEQAVRIFHTLLSWLESDHTPVNQHTQATLLDKDGQQEAWSVVNSSQNRLPGCVFSWFDGGDEPRSQRSSGIFSRVARVGRCMD